MSAEGQGDGIKALGALLAARERLPHLAEADFAQAAIQLAKRELTAAGQRAQTIADLRTALGPRLFREALFSLTLRQAASLARRIHRGRTKPEFDGLEAAIAHVLATIDALRPATPPPADPDLVATAESFGNAVTPSAEPGPVSVNPGAYFGRKAFRTGG